MNRNHTLFSLTLVLWCALGSGCSYFHKDPLTPPQAIVAPYDTGRGEVLWAVVPPRNESGTTALDVLSVGDALVAAVEEVRGVRCVPLNRTIEAMRALKVESVATPSEARALAQAMRVDGILVGSVTAYDPYTPQIGLAIALYARPGSMSLVDEQPPGAKEIASQRTDSQVKDPRMADKPLAIASENFDARNHQVLADLRTYASGREKEDTALGWKSYTASVHRFTEFAAYRTVNTLIEQEWLRVGAGQTSVTSSSDKVGARKAASNQVVDRQVDTATGRNRAKPLASAEMSP